MRLKAEYKKSNRYVQSKRSFKDITGQRFGRLVVLGFDEERYYTRPQLYWKVRCDCGTEKSVRTCSLKTTTKSCGCLQKEAAAKNGRSCKKDPYLKSTNDIFINYKRRAKKQKIQFDLTIEEFREFLKQNCYYCGIYPNNKHINRRTKDVIKYSGLDRVDSNKGYVVSNIVPSCIQCNLSKLDFSKEEFYNWILRLYKNLENKNVFI